jgi:hypothetical protein
LFFEIAVEGIDKDRINPQGRELTSLTEAEDPLNPPVPFLTCGSLAAFTPQHGKPEHPFCVVVCRRDAFFNQKQPQGTQLPLNATDKLAGIILSTAV